LQRRVQAAHQKGAAMSAPTLDRTTADFQPTAAASRRRRRPLLLLIAASLLLIAGVVGTTLALVDRPAGQPTVAAGTGDPAAADQPTGQDVGQSARPERPADADRPTGSGLDTSTGQDTNSGGGTDQDAPFLADGSHDVYIKRVDQARNRLVIDVVQVFHDDAAVKAAIADGRSPEEARYLTTWVRNENPRLRFQQLADNLSVRFRDTCGEPAGSREAMLSRLAENARQGIFYYTLTVSGGNVTKIQEQLAVNAC
jgi:hypothetical protein